MSSSDFTIGEPDGTRSERVKTLSDALTGANFESADPRSDPLECLAEALGQRVLQPDQALTHATLDRITTEPGLRQLCKQMMHEAKAVTEALGINIPEDMIDRRLAAAGSVVGHKMSMLQDLERHRSMEIDALVTAVQELGRLTGVPTPAIDVVLALVQECGRQAGLYGTPA